MKRLHRHRDLAPLGDPSLSRLHSALTAAPSPEELGGENDALTAFRAVSWDRRSRLVRPALWRPAVLTSLLATKLGVAVAAGAVGLSGVSAAAYAGVLPDTLQDVAHKTIKAPAAHKSNGVGPDAKGDAAWGLCQAFNKDKDKGEQGNGNGKAGERGKSKERSVAFRNLAEAAGGADKIEAYCAKVPKPTDTESPTTSGKPADKPGKPADKPGKPTAKLSHPTSAQSKPPTPQASAVATTSPTAVPSPTEASPTP